ncbi:MAG: hypothetical protein M3P26_17950 [Gemmatimonadota bacterium]|nr:hypothetical protein [Gemmatimonadota bacterium]
MQLRAIILAAAILLTGSLAAAQDVRIEVVEASNGKAIVGANVSVLDSSGATLGGGFSDQGGHIDLPVPMRAPFRVRADKVSYDTWISVVLRPAAKPIHVRIGMTPTRTPTVVARTETACQQLSGPGTPAGDLWAQLRKALTASAMTEAQGMVPLDVDLYERVLDRNLAVVSERTEQRTKVPRRPATGISWDQLDSARRGDATGAEVYHAPDAATFLSEQFVKSHCFGAIRGYGPENGLTGLEFKPAKVGALPELTGVIWLDPRANTLQYLNFDYVNLPIPLRVARTTGRVDFQHLAGGQWIVPRWYLRMPRTARVTSTSFGSPSVVRDSLVGYQEVGGTARLAGTAAERANAAPITAAAAATQSVLMGVVYDSTTGRPLKDVEVSTGGGRFKTVTSGGGRYELAIDGAVSDKVIFEHPRLRLFRIPERVQTITLPAGSRAQAVVIVPSYGTLRNRLCGQNESRTEAQAMAVGYVRDAAGNPVANAHVWATWQILWIEQNGRLVSTNQQRTVETDTGPDGSYLLCGFTRGAQITAKVGMAGKSTVQEKLVIPPNMVLEHNFQMGAR